jgi:acetyl-CoA carboxylase carboxyltransferase component
MLNTGRISGVTDHYASNDEHALQIARNIVETLNLSKKPDVSVHNYKNRHIFYKTWKLKKHSSLF